MLDPRSWLDEAKTLDIGRSKRVDHDCGSGRTLKVDHKEHGWGAYCWRCSDDGWVPHPEESLAQRLARLTAVKAVEAEASRSVALPTPAEHDAALWPKEARLWLYKIGMSNDDIRKAGFYWCQRLERVVLPVYGDNRTVLYWQARFVGPKMDRPKYLNPLVDKSSFFARYGKGKEIVLTEDILSAWKVGQCTAAWSILGTSLSQSQCLSVMRHGLPVYIWLDPDAAGIRAASKIFKQLTAYGVDARVIRSDTDPKLLSREDIRRKLYG
jgi:DNA primase